MTLTIASNTSPLCPVSEFLKRCDLRTVGDWASDTGVRVAEAALPTNANVLAAVADASGDVESAAFLGQRYQPADLALLAATTCNGQAKLFRILADIAISYLYERRPAVHEQAKPPAGMERATVWLQELAKGTRIFPFLESAQTGQMDIQVETAMDVDNRNGTVVQAVPFFGVRSNRRTPFQGAPGNCSDGGWLNW